MAASAKWRMGRRRKGRTIIKRRKVGRDIVGKEIWDEQLSSINGSTMIVGCDCGAHIEEVMWQLKLTTKMAKVYNS